MEFGLSTHLFVGKKLNTRILQRIEGAGFDLLEIFGARQHFDYQNANQIEEVSSWISDHPLRLRSFHAPLFKGFDWERTGARPLPWLTKKSATVSTRWMKSGGPSKLPSIFLSST